MADTIPSCPKCSKAMKLRTSARGSFWGCTGWRKYGPSCNGSRPYRDPKLAAATEKWAADFNATPEQSNIFHYILNGTGHLVIKALAGTGKSTTCRVSMYKLPRHLKVIYLCFGKDNVREFNEKPLPENCEVMTINSLGNQIIHKAFPQLSDKAFEDKVASIIDELYHTAHPDAKETDRGLLNAVEKMVGLCQGCLIDGTDAAVLLELATKHDVELDAEFADEAMAMVPQVLAIDAERTSTFSFNDQIWWPIKLGLTVPKYDLVYVDEAQDLNACQHELAKRILNNAGRVVVVGDDNQAIYGFRGSDVDSIPNFAALLATTGLEVTELPLTVTQRCDRAIVAMAQQYVPELRARASAGEGEIINTAADAAMDLYRIGDMVLCRINAPLASIAYGLIRKGIKAIIRGRDIGTGLLLLINKSGQKNVGGLLAWIESWRTSEIEKWSKCRRAEQIAQRINDQSDCIVALCEGVNDLSELRANIVALFQNFEPSGAPRSAVVLSSIHKAKGLESDRVFWYAPDTTCKCAQDWQVRQERNLKYVAITRAKHTLVLVAEAGKGKGKNKSKATPADAIAA
jgi:superfamily I DNA/RNA helicase